MKKFQVSFTDRLKNAIGIRYTINHIVEARDKEEALLMCYEKYEDITFPVIKEITDNAAQ